MGDPVTITKANGEKEPFDRSKLEHSLRRAGAADDVVETVADYVEEQLESEISTKKIYGIAFDRLRAVQRTSAARYSLRQAIFDLGPTGFPFEEFVRALFDAEGYTTKTRIRMKGACANHEVDVLACTDEGCEGVEAKFHNSQGVKSDLQTGLYVYARYEDLKQQAVSEADGDHYTITTGWLITNTKFTDSLISYAECAGLHLLGWNHPREENIQDKIEAAGVQPITALTTLPDDAQRQLLEDNIVLCRTIIGDPNLLRSHGVSERDADAVLEEAHELCNA